MPTSWFEHEKPGKFCCRPLEAHLDKRKLHVRVATAEDQPAVKALVFEVLEEFGIAACTSDPQDRDLDDLASWYAPPGGVFEVLIDESGRVLGCGGVHRLSAERCELRKMYFRPELRGQGVGSAFLHRLIRFARRAGYRSMELETASALHAAIALYQRRGFREIAQKRDLERCDRAFELVLADYRAPATLMADEGDDFR